MVNANPPGCPLEGLKSRFIFVLFIIVLVLAYYFTYGLPSHHPPLEAPLPRIPRHQPLRGKILVTGAAGFIGYHMSLALLTGGNDVQVIGVDNLNSFYSVELKLHRVALLHRHANFTFIKMDLANSSATAELFARHTFSYVIHLAAQAGVRYSFDHPHEYVSSNLVAFVNIIEGMRGQPKSTHLMYASSSSVYGGNTNVPFSEDQRVDSPLNLYAATKKADEGLAYSYASLYNIPMTGLRFFTVFGPWGRPDMAMWQFTEAMVRGEPIKLFNNGAMQRDFTYISDIIDGMLLLLRTPPTSLNPPHRVVNIGGSQPIQLKKVVRALEAAIGVQAHVQYVKEARGEVPLTYADVRLLERLTGFKPRVEFCVGVQIWVDWYLSWLTDTVNATIPSHSASSAAACKA